MDIFNLTCLGIATLALIIAAIFVASARRAERKVLSKLNEMLDIAINGTFTENTFDESALSAVEAKMARFLSSCAVSSKNLSDEKNKIKELISDISHQTKTPIANILLYTQLLKECQLPVDCVIQVDTLSVQAEKLSFLIESLVKTSRLETGIITITSQKGNVGELVKAAVSQAEAKAKAKDMAIYVETSECTAYFDKKWTAEAIYNILDNAVKYSPNGSKINISIISYELFCRVDIADEGLGISEDEQSRVFARFYRSAEVTNCEGVGIGLFLAREIITSGGGYIKLSSTPGKGSVFSVFLATEKH